MKQIVTLLFVLIAGCASTPAEVREQGSRAERTFKASDAQRVAQCVRRNAENASGYISASINPLARNPEGAEVMVRGTDAGVLAIIELAPVGYSAMQAKAWITPQEWHEADGLLNYYLQGCDR